MIELEQLYKTLEHYYEELADYQCYNEWYEGYIEGLKVAVEKIRNYISAIKKNEMDVFIKVINDEINKHRQEQE